MELHAQGGPGGEGDAAAGSGGVGGRVKREGLDYRVAGGFPEKRGSATVVAAQRCYEM